MKESILHYIWQFKKFELTNLYTLCGKKIEIIKTGNYNTNAGPDFSFAKIKIDDIEWLGNIEIHTKSSDFERHNHHLNPAYNNIILHIVYEHDKNVAFLEDKNIPTLELKSFIPDKLISNFNLLENKNYQFIPCEKLFTNYSSNPLLSEKLYLSKLENKCKQISELLANSNNNWEFTLASILAYTFGLKVNAEAFAQLFQCIDYKIIKKIASKQILLEALFFGLTNHLNDDDAYSSLLIKEFNYLKSKFNIPDQNIELKYLRLRPANFPTIRLSQLASLFSEYQNLFSYVIGAKNIEQYFKLLDDIKASSYWETHYTFGKSSNLKIEKRLSKSQKELIILNAFLPVKFAYSVSIGKPMEDEIINIINQLPIEKNSIIDKYKLLGIKFKSALDSQAFLYLYKNKCCHKQCLNCEIGYDILR